MTSLTLNSEALVVTVDAEVPRILEYQHKLTGGRILGSIGKGTPSVEILRKEDNRRAIVEWEAMTPRLKVNARRITWRCTASMDGRVAATFDYSISVLGETVEIAMGNVVETRGYNLLGLKFPADPIIRVSNELPGAKACTGNLTGPGSLVDPGEPVPEQFEFGLLSTDTAAAGIYCNVITKPLRATSMEGWTGIWCADFRYSFKDEKYEPFYCKIGIVADRNGDGRIDWQDAAIAIHDFIPNRVSLRTECLKYMANHGMNFAEFVDRVREICYLTDGHPQLCLLAGWNGWGWDSEYPSCDFPGEEFGGREGLYALHRGARRYNCYTTMIHNFDDAYKDSPAWDESIIAVREDGRLWDATWWSGGPSFIISPYKFWKSGAAQKTIDTLIAQGVEHQIFSDVFSILPYRESHDKGDESDPLTNLVLGKFKILDYLRQHDIYMNSEGFNYEMLGRWIGGHNGFDPGLSNDASKPPLSLFITHGLMNRKFWSVGKDDFHASDEGRFVGGDTEVLPNPWNLDVDYLWAMLISFYGDKPMKRFSVEGQTYHARYGDDVDVAWERDKRVTVSVGGRMIFDGESCLLPKPGRANVYRAYTRTGEKMVYPCPTGWTDPSKLVVMRLTKDAPPQAMPTGDLVKLEGDQIILNLPKGVPHKVLYGKELVGQEQAFPSLPPKFLTYPLDEVVERIGGEKRPVWVLKTTRKALEPNPGQERLAVGCSGCFSTLEAARNHAASIVARKIGWFTRRKYVHHTREHEQAFGWKNGYLDMGYDNWYLGYVSARNLFTLEAINQRPGTEWYAEQVLHGPERKVMWKAFVATPITADDCKQVYLQAAKQRLAECREQLARNEGDRQLLENNIKVYEKLLAEEPAKEPIVLDWDMW